MEFDQWLQSEKRILLHAGGQSRRLPSYAPSGKILTPVPVFRWEIGQRLSQDLLHLQLPLYERLIELAPDNIHTMVVSGDVYIRASRQLPPVPSADIVCYGLWLDSSIARNHGVFVSDRTSPSVLKQMLQKPSVETLNDLLQSHYYLTDIGVWLLSDRAVRLLARHSKDSEGRLREYDLYSEFGCSVGTHPLIDEPDLRQLSVAILPLPEGEFYHYGTTREMISSTLAVQNIINDHRDRLALIFHRQFESVVKIPIAHFLCVLTCTHRSRKFFDELNTFYKIGLSCAIGTVYSRTFQHRCSTLTIYMIRECFPFRIGKQIKSRFFCKRLVIVYYNPV